MKQRILYILVLCALVSCRTAQNLPEGETLYTGASIRYNNKGELENNREITSNLEQYLRPKPNALFFGIARFRLWVYQHTKEPKKEKGLRHWLKNKLGEEPVLLSDANFPHVREQLDAVMFNEGYFFSRVDYEVKKANRKASVVYTIDVAPRYHLDTVIYPPADSTQFIREVAEMKEGSPLFEKNEVPYSLSMLEAEKDRIEYAMKEKGYYFFNESQLLFRADTTIGGKEVKLNLTFQELSEKSTRSYTIGEVRVNTFYGRGDSLPLDTLVDGKGLVFIGRDSIFRPEALSRYIYVVPGSVYSKSAQERTITRLSGLGVFEFVNVVYEETGDSNILDVYIQLTPTKRRTLKSEVNLTTKSSGFTGPNMELGWVNRNLFKGAEYYELRLDGGLEAQLLSGGEDLFSYEIGANNELRFPKTLSIIKTPLDSLAISPPQTRIQLGFRFLDRMQFYRMTSFNFSYGYRWVMGKSIQHEVDPISIVYMNISNTTALFRERLSENPALARSFEQQFIIGPRYSFTYNPPPDNEKLFRFFFKGEFESSGNILYAVIRPMQGRRPTVEDPFTIAGLPFAQYLKTDLDFRAYLNITDEVILAMRQFVGLGVPYLNSRSMPFIKQYFTGGASSVRAFRYRSVGPGTYSADSLGGFYYLDQSGDIKLETNIELRFPIQNALKGALFVDAGNNWLLNENPDKPGGAFRAAEVINELAVGVGAGLRLDLNFFVLRFDVATPVRSPFGTRNVPARPGIGSGLFGQNVVLNLAIGYPF